MNFLDGSIFNVRSREVNIMHILALVLLFLVASIAATCSGDFSGLAAIGKFVGGAILVFVMLWLFTQPALLIVVILAVIVIAVCCLGK